MTYFLSKIFNHEDSYENSENTYFVNILIRSKGSETVLFNVENLALIENLAPIRIFNNNSYGFKRQNVCHKKLIFFLLKNSGTYFA